MVSLPGHLHDEHQGWARLDCQAEQLRVRRQRQARTDQGASSSGASQPACSPCRRAFHGRTASPFTSPAPLAPASEYAIPKSSSHGTRASLVFFATRIEHAGPPLRSRRVDWAEGDRVVDGPTPILPRYCLHPAFVPTALPPPYLRRSTLASSTTWSTPSTRASSPERRRA